MRLPVLRLMDQHGPSYDLWSFCQDSEFLFFRYERLEKISVAAADQAEHAGLQLLNVSVEETGCNASRSVLAKRLCIPVIDVREDEWGMGWVPMGEGAGLDAIGQRKWRPVRAFMGTLIRASRLSPVKLFSIPPSPLIYTSEEPHLDTTESPAETLAASALYITRTTTVTRARAPRYRKYGALQVNAHHDPAGY